MFGVVRRVTWLTPGLVRITLADGELDRFEARVETDAYINVAIPPADAPYGPVFDPTELKNQVAPELMPTRRRYTVRAWRPDKPELDVDFVVHGGDGVAGPWSAAARPGDVLVFTGPGGGYRPDPAADWHLLVGDESALPAIAASLEVLPDGVPAVVRVLTDGPEHDLPLESPADLDLHHLHRSPVSPAANPLLESVQAASFPPGRVHAFVHGEADETRALRRHLLGERGFTRQQMSCSPYWRRTMTDEAWRTIKRAYVQDMESDQH